MEITRIKYKELGDLIEITEITGAANSSQIESEFGKCVYAAYTNGEPYYTREMDGYYVILRQGKALAVTYVTVNSVWKKEKFSWVIETMKKAAKRLIEIRKNLSIEKTIEI